MIILWGIVYPVLWLIAVIDRRWLNPCVVHGCSRVGIFPVIVVNPVRDVGSLLNLCNQASFPIACTSPAGIKKNFLLFSLSGHSIDP